MTHVHPRRRDERGTALLEMALTLPLLLLVSAGIFEFGRGYQTWQVLTNAAREGARIAVLPGTTDSDVQLRVTTYLEAGQLADASSAAVTITHNTAIPIGLGTASGSTVAVSYPFEFSVLQPIAELLVPTSKAGKSLSIVASATMRNE